MITQSKSDFFTDENTTTNAAVAAIQFAITAEEGMNFLRLWNEGAFDDIREWWPEAPEDIYIGADPLYVPHSKSPDATIEIAQQVINEIPEMKDVISLPLSIGDRGNDGFAVVTAEGCDFEQNLDRETAILYCRAFNGYDAINAEINELSKDRDYWEGRARDLARDIGVNP